MMQSRTTFGALFLSLFAAGACASGADTDPGEMYRLASVGGQPLPVSYPEDAGCEEEILAATLELEDDGEWEMAISSREICGDAVATDEDEESGSYTVDGMTYRFDGADGAEPATTPGEIDIDELVEGTLSGGTLTATLRDGTRVVFERQQGAGSTPSP